MKHVIVERIFPEPVDMQALRDRIAASALCYDSRRITHLRTCLSLDGRRMICEYSAPDAESVRLANVQAGVPFERVWTAHVLEPTPPPADGSAGEAAPRT